MTDVSRSMKKSGMGLVEVLFALGPLSVAAVPLVTLLVRSVADTRAADRRLVLGLRSRRHQAEVVTTTFDAVLAH